MKYLFSCLFWLSCLQIWGQPTSRPIGLREAMDLAVQHSEQVKKARLDRQGVDLKISEQRSAALPQVSAGASFDVFPLLPTQLIPGEVLGNPQAGYVPVQFGRPWQLTGTLQADQILYSEAGRRMRPAAQLSQHLADLLIERTADEVRFQTAQLYVQYQQTRLLQRTLDANTEKLQALQRMADLQLKAGYITPTDVKRIQVARTTLETQRIQLLNGLQSLRETLSTICDESAVEPLTDTLSNITADSLKWLSLSITPSDNPIELEFLYAQMELNHLQTRAAEASRWPSLHAYATGWLQNQRGNPNFFDPSKRWYGMMAIGLRSQVTLFDGRKSKHRKALLGIENEKIKADVRQVLQYKKLELQQAQTQLRATLYTLIAQGDNVILARDVRDKLALQYREGAITLTDLLNAQTSLTEAETTYSQQVYNYRLAVLKIAKITGRLNEL
jgi:outer membrane protein